MITAAEFVQEAQEWVGTPYHHQARAKGIGCDCVGLFVGFGERLGVKVLFESDYPTTFHGPVLREYMERNCVELLDIGATDAPPGSILAFTLRADPGPHHVALRTPAGMLHAWRGGVVEHPLKWLGRVDSVWWHPEVSR